MIQQELRNLILKIRNERKNKGNTKGRVADTFDGMMDFVDSKFIRNSSESLTTLGTPTLTDNTLYLKYTGENGVEQTVSADLSGLTPEVILPTKTSEFRNDGEDGLNPFITALDIPEVVLPTRTSELINDGEDGNSFITLYDIPAPIPQVNSNWNATSGPGVILNKPTELSQFNNDTRFITIDDIPEVDVSTKADKDASNLSAPNVISWRNALDIYSKSQVDTALALKLDKPQTDGSWVVTRSGTTYSYTDASNFGKNIGNSHITSIINSSFTLGANYTINTSGYYFNILGLPNKSADQTFDRIRVQDVSGREAFVDNPYHVLKNGLGRMTAEQGIELGQLFNGGSGSAGSINVNLISPPIVQQIDSVEYIYLRGINLNLNAVSKKIELLNAATNEVIVTIPDHHIQLYNDGLSLVFQYNPLNLPIGEYKIRLTSGPKIYVTTLLLKCVTNIDNINLDNITWDVIYNQPSDNIGNNVTVGRNTYIDNPVGERGQTIAISAKSSELFAQGDDFYLELQISTTDNVNQWFLTNLNDFSDFNKSFIGIGYSSSPNTFSVNSLINISYDYWGGVVGGVGGQLRLRYHSESTLIKEFLHTQTPGVINVVIVKTGNLFRIVTEGINISKTLSNNSGYSLFLNIVRRKEVMQSTGVQVIKAFKFY